MKVLFLSLGVLATLNVFAQDREKLLRVQSERGINIVFNDDTFYKFKEDNVYLQNGQKITKKQLEKGSPSCQVLFDANVKDQLKGFVALRDQEFFAFNTKLKSMSGSLFGLDLNKYSFDMQFNGVISDTEAAGITDEQLKMLSSTFPGFLRVILSCSGFKVEPSLEEFKNVVGNSLFTIKTDTVRSYFDDVQKLSPSYQEIKKKREEEDREYEAKRKAELEKKQKEEEERKIAQAIEAKKKKEEFYLSFGKEVVEDGDELAFEDVTAFIIDDEFKVPTNNSKYTSFIYQEGKLAGAANAQGMYTLKDKELDKSKPFCALTGSQVMQLPNSKEIKFVEGIYEKTSIEVSEAKQTVEIKGNFKTEYDGERVVKVNVYCFNTKSLSDVRSSLGAKTRIFISQSDDGFEKIKK